MTTPVWAARAGSAERAVHSRHLRRLWGLPGTRLARLSWPPRPLDRAALRWVYWWQAHTVDALVDGFGRAPSSWRLAAVERLVTGIRLRNLTGWTNRYYDDIAWLGLALGRAHEIGVVREHGRRAITAQLCAGRSDIVGGALIWRVGDDFANVPANGPAAILFARRGELDIAASLVDWMVERLRDPDTGLMFDGLRFRPDGSVYEVVRTHYTYCQGVVLGAAVELAARTTEPRWAQLASDLVTAVDTHLAPGGVLRGHGPGDGGLFTGILARYLAMAARADALPEATRAAARRLVLDSAEAAWTHRGIAVGGPVFGPSWDEPALAPAGDRPERDLSVQLSGWFLTEAAALVEDRS